MTTHARAHTLQASVSTHRLPLRRPFRTGAGEWHHRESCVLELRCGELVAHGEAAPLPGFSTESFEEVSRQLVQLSREHLEGSAPPASVEEVEAFMGALPAAAPSTRFALETALLDLLAQQRGVPLHLLLQDALASHEQDLPARFVEVNATIGSMPAPEAFSVAMRLKDEGFSCFKIKVGARPLDEELGLVRAVRDAIGDACTIRLDANGAWKSADEAIDAIERFLAYTPIDLIEQPTPADEVAMLATVTRRFEHTTQIAADEAIRSEEDAARILDARAATVLVLKPMLLGGLLTSCRIMQQAGARHVKAILTTMLEGTIGRLATTHLAVAARAHLHGPCGLATGTLLEEDLLPDPIEFVDGRAYLSDKPGLGLTEEMAPGLHASARHDALQMQEPLLLARARSHAPKLAMWHDTPDGEDARLTYEELGTRARKLVSWLVERGIMKGDRVVFCAPNSPELVCLIHALMLRGACMIPLHPRYTTTELQAAISRTRPALVLLDREGEDALWHEAITSLAEATRQADALPPASHAHVRGHDMEDLAAILLTSGTTGAPKLAALTWHNLFYSALGSTIRLGHLPQDRWLLALPLCHIGGLSIVLRCVLLGTTVALHERFDAARTAQLIVTGQITMCSAVSAMMWRVLEEMPTGVRAHANFRFALLGGGSVPTSLIEACAARGIEVATTYGLTEASSQVATRAPSMQWISPESAGPPLLFTQARVEAPQEMAHDGAGEVFVRGESVSAGYLDERLEVVSARDGAGWFGTGDIARQGAFGELYILDRRSDLIVTGGENVYPAEIEHVLREHDGICDVCVIGLPDERWGEQVVAVIIPQEDAGHLERLAAHLISRCSAQLASFKVPRQVMYWGEPSFPRTSLGKLQRARVRAHILERHLREQGEEEGRGQH